MPGHNQCPDHDTLAALLLGQLSPDHEEQVIQHLESCAACEARAQQLESQTDPLLEALRHPGTQGKGSAKPVSASAPTLRAVAPSSSIQVSGFEILAEIGRGGMGVVYRALQHRLKRVVAIKMIVSGQLADAEQRVRFLMEGSLLARLNHPNFVQVYEVGTLQTESGTLQPYLVLEHVNGGNLKKRLAAGPMSVPEAGRITLCLARAMEAAHAQGVVHRDLKPANILIALDGKLKITDFGLAKELGVNASLTPTGLTVGTPNYMAPEQARGSSGVGPAADVYALGIILYEMLAGRPPFEGNTPMTVLLQVLDQAPAALTRSRADVPRDLETICLKCLEKEPQRRYATARELADDLEAWLENRPIRARGVGRLERAFKWVQRHPLPAALLLLLIISLLGGSAASTYFGVTAYRRAEETELARLASDRRAAELELLAGQRLAADGEVDRGLFTMVRGWQQTPAKDTDLQRVFQRNLEAWSLYLPRVRWQTESRHTGYLVCEDDEIVGGHDNELSVLDAATGRPLGPARTYAGDVVAALSPDGRLVCTRTLRDKIVTFLIFERASGKQVMEIVDARGGALWGSGWYSARFSPDGKFLFREFVGPKRQERQIWDLATGAEAGTAMVGSASAVEFVQDDAGGLYWLFIQDDGRVVVKDARTGEEKAGGAAVLPRTARRIPRLFPHPDIGQGVLWEKMTWWDIQRDAGLSSPWRVGLFSGEQLSPDGRLALTMLGDQRLCWRAVASRQLLTPTAATGPNGGPLHTDGRTCLYVHANERIKLLDFPLLSPAHVVGGAVADNGFRAVAPPQLRFASATFSADGGAALFHKPGLPLPHFYARLTRTSDNRLVGLPMTECDGPGAFSGTGNLLALATRDHNEIAKLVVRVHDAHTGEPRGGAFTTKYFVHTLAFSPDERLLLIGDVAGATIANLETGKTTPVMQPGPIVRALWSPDGRQVALLGLAGWPKSRAGVQVWDVARGESLGPLLPMNDAPVIFHEEGTTFRTLELDAGRMRRWDFTTGSVVADLGVLSDWPGPQRGDLWTVRDDHQRFALGSRQGSIWQWDLTTGRRLEPVADFRQPCQALQYSPDGRWLAVNGDDGEVGLFDPHTAKQAGPLLTQGVPVRRMAFTRDAAHLLAATADGRCIRWPLATEQVMTPAQWQLWLEGATGMQLDGDSLVPLSVAEYHQRVANARDLPLALSLPRESAAEWHADEAFAAEHAGQLNSALWHLDRWIGAEPNAWLPRARRARVHFRAGNLTEAEADLMRASELGGGKDLDNWRLHQAVVGRITGRRMKLFE